MTSRIVIIGAHGYKAANGAASVESIQREQIARIGTLSGHDIVILNLLARPQDRRVDWDAFSRLLKVDTMAEILGHDDRIIVLGESRFSVGRRDSIVGRVLEAPFLSWSGPNYEWDDWAGESIQVTFKYDDRRERGELEGYLTHLKKWSCSCRSAGLADLRDGRLIKAFGIDEMYFLNKGFDSRYRQRRMRAPATESCSRRNTVWWSGGGITETKCILISFPASLRMAPSPCCPRHRLANEIAS